jgi:hypothetical protein
VGHFSKETSDGRQIVFSCGDYVNVHGFGLATIYGGDGVTLYVLEGALILP